MKKVLKSTLGLLLIGCVVLVTTGSALAESFNRNRIIDDYIFDNVGSMNASQIDAFLNGFAHSCISTNSGFRAIEPTGYNPTNGFQYGGFVTAGQVIARSADVYNINPQVLLATLEKEQSLVTGRNNSSGYCNNGIQHKYAASMGYGCPDNIEDFNYTGTSLYQRHGTTVTNSGTTCVNSAAKAGFSQQVIRAAWLLKFSEERSKGNVGWAIIEGNWDNSDDLQSCYSGFMTKGTYQRCPSGPSTYYDGNITIDGTAVQLESGATASLYVYTPHFHGNEVFFSLFTGWFGSTTSSGFTWQPVSQSAFSDANMTTPQDLNNLVVGQRYLLNVQVKNNGQKVWYKDVVNLATNAPKNRSSSFYDSTWLSGNRAATLNQASVAPGETGTFTFWVKPSQTGSFKEYFNLVADGYAWMNDLGLHFQMTANNPRYSWAPHEQRLYTDEARTQLATTNHIKRDVRVYAQVKVTNNSNVNWNKNSVRLATSHPNDRYSPFHGGQWLSVNRAANLDQDVVKPGEIGTFTFSMKMPVNNGYYKEYFNLVVEGARWMPDLGMYYDFHVHPNVYAWQPYSQKAYTDDTKLVEADLNSVTPGNRYYLQVQVRNSGNVRWLKGGVNLATSQPKDRISTFRDNTWLSGNRAATLQEEVVEQGEIGTYEFWVTAPSFSGDKKEYFNIVAEGITWMPDLGMYYGFRSN